MSGGRVRTLAPKGAIAPTGTWSVGARAGDFVYVAGMRGIDPATNMLIAGDEAPAPTISSGVSVVSISSR